MQEKMKKLNSILHNRHAAAFVLLTALLAACKADPIEMEVGSGAAYDPVGKVRPGFYSPLASNDTMVLATVKPGEKFEDVLTFGLTKEAPADVEVEFSLFTDEEWLNFYNQLQHYVDIGWGENHFSMWCSYLPDEVLTVPLGKKSIAAGEYGLRFDIAFDLPKVLEGTYQRMVVLQASYTDDGDQPKTVRYYYQLRYDPIAEKSFDRRKKSDLAGFEENPFLPYVTILINPSWLDPRSVREFDFARTKRVAAEGINETLSFEAVDAVEIWGATIGYDEEEQMPELQIDPNLFQLLHNNSKYLAPIRDDGIKVSVIVSGGGMGIGFCNLDDAQRASLVEQIRKMIVRYQIDGVNLYDEASGYGRNGMPDIDPASYAKFIRDLRTALPDKSITLTDVGEPSATLYETPEGIRAGQYLDYAWTGKFLDWTDPYEANAPRKPIPGLDRSKYGLLFVRYRDYDPNWEMDEENYNRLMERKSNPDVPHMLTVELMPMIEGAEMWTGANMFSSFSSYVLPDRYMIPGGGRRDAISWGIGNEGVTEFHKGATQIPSTGLGIPGYANMLYYPDWLRF